MDRGRTHRRAVVLALAAVAGTAALAATPGVQAKAGPGPDCTDKAEPLDPSPLDDREMVTVAAQDGSGRVLTAWMSGGPNPFQVPVSVLLGQRDPKGSWSYEELAPNGGDAWFAPTRDGDVYLSYISVRGPTLELPVFVRRISPGKPAGPPLKVGAKSWQADHPSLAVDPLDTEGDRLFVVSSFATQPGLLVSEDGGETWLDEIEPWPDAAGPYPLLAAGGASVVAVTGGIYGGPTRSVAIDRQKATFGAIHTLGHGVGSRRNPFAYNWFPAITAVRDGGYVGRIYASYPEVVTKDAPPRLVYRFSDDSGASWSDARLLSDAGPGNWETYPSLAPLPDGGAYAFFYDSRADDTGLTAELYGTRIDESGEPGPNERVACPTLSYTGERDMADYIQSDTMLLEDRAPRPITAYPRVIDSNAGTADPFFTFAPVG